MTATEPAQYSMPAMNDLLRLDYINNLPQPFTAVFLGGDKWPVEDIDVQTGLMRIDVCGKLQVKNFYEVTSLIDSDGEHHKSETFYSDYDHMTFKIGDYVYHCPDEVGKITDTFPTDNGDNGYRVNYCQGKDLSTGTRGGNGPIFIEGFPKPVTEGDDLLFVLAMKQKDLIADLTIQINMAKGDLEALRRARSIAYPPTINQNQ